jgi:hypothetical protein
MAVVPGKKPQWSTRRHRGSVALRSPQDRSGADGIGPLHDGGPARIEGEHRGGVATASRPLPAHRRGAGRVPDHGASATPAVRAGAIRSEPGPAAGPGGPVRQRGRCMATTTGPTGDQHPHDNPHGGNCRAQRHGQAASRRSRTEPTAGTAHLAAPFTNGSGLGPHLVHCQDGCGRNMVSPLGRSS